MSNSRKSHALLALLIVSLIGWTGVSCGGGGGGSGGHKKKSEVKGFRILEIEPQDGALFVPIDSEIRVRFSATVRIDSVSTDNVLLSLRSTGRPVKGSLRLESANSVLVFTPDQNLLLNTKYRFRILPDVLSSTGVPLGEEFVSVFTSGITTGGPGDKPPPVTLGTFRVIHGMNVGRSSHTATLLDGDRVLITGGFVNAYAVTNSAEVFDPVDEVFEYTLTNMQFSRGFHTATRLLNGKVLVLGGVSGANVTESNTAEIFDPITNRFSTLSPGMIYPRAFHTATLLDDGRVLICGGTVPTSAGVFSSRKAEIFDPVKNGFSALPDMHAYRAAHTATKLDSGDVLILGGNGTDKTIEIFDPDKNEFLDTEQKLLVARRGHTATRLSSTGNVVVMGGGTRTAGIWVTKDGKYVSTNGLPLEDRKDHTAAETTSGRILFSGGSRIQGSITIFSQTSEYYDRQSGIFLGSAPLMSYPTTRRRSTVLSDGRILLTGGANLDPKLNELKAAEIYEEED